MIVLAGDVKKLNHGASSKQTEVSLRNNIKTKLVTLSSELDEVDQKVPLKAIYFKFYT